jgi:exodeoxyribonuclease VII small subunit
MDMIAELSFEDALKRLEAIVGKLESGQATLEESIDLYEQGQRLKQHCDAKLKAASERIEKIQVGSGGEAVGVAPFGPAGS